METSAGTQPILTARVIDTPGIEVGREPRGLDGELVLQWDALAIAIVQYAYADRPACVIETALRGRAGPMLMPQLAIQPGIKIDGGKLRVFCFDECPTEILESIAVDWVFQMQQLAVTSIQSEWDLRVPRLLRELAAYSRMGRVPTTREEAIASHADSSSLVWLNPTMPREVLMSDLEALAHSSGWSFRSASSSND